MESDSRGSIVASHLFLVDSHERFLCCYTLRTWRSNEVINWLRCIELWVSKMLMYFELYLLCLFLSIAAFFRCTFNFEWVTRFDCLFFEIAEHLAGTNSSLSVLTWTGYAFCVFFCYSKYSNNMNHKTDMMMRSWWCKFRIAQNCVKCNQIIKQFSSSSFNSTAFC